MIYTIVDIETTGNGNKITEISIFKFDETTVIDEFTSLINPESLIPPNITELTGINNHMVASAPVFKDVAQDILDITQDAIFVAHNVNFDYNIIASEFKKIGVTFNKKKLCTVRLSRKLLPGHKSYSLGKLCSALNINLVGRHRARGDAQVTVVLFELLLKQPNSNEVFEYFLNKNSIETKLPPNLPKTVFETLPNKPGIYYFKDKKGEVIYVGKAIDIKKQVLSHFYSKTKKAVDMVTETSCIDFEISGSEFIALLMEDAAIKRHIPIYNKISKRTLQSYAIFTYEDRKGILHLATNKRRLVTNPIITFYSVTQVRLYLEKICAKFNLCPKYCHLQEAINECSHYNLKYCKGVCINQETIKAYNNRVLEAIYSMKDDIIIKEKGRNANEDAFVMIKNGVYLGYGFIEKDIQINHIDDLEFYLVPQKNNIDIEKILRSKILQL